MQTFIKFNKVIVAGIGNSPLLSSWRAYLGDCVTAALQGPHTPDFAHVKKYSNDDIRHDAIHAIAMSALSTILRVIYRSRSDSLATKIWPAAEKNFLDQFGKQRMDANALASLFNLFVYGGIMEKTMYVGSYFSRLWPVSHKKTVADVTRYPYPNSRVLPFEAACVHPVLKLHIVRELLGSVCVDEVERMMRQEILAETIRLLLYAKRLPDTRKAFLPFVYEACDDEGIEHMADIILFENTSGATRYVNVSIEPSLTELDMNHAAFFLDPAHVPAGFANPAEVVVLYDGPTKKAKNGIHPYSCMDFIKEYITTQSLENFFATTAGRKKYGFEEMYGDFAH